MSTLPKQAIKHSYRVVPERFLAGEYPRTLDERSSQTKIAALLDTGVTAFIDLTEKTESLSPYKQLLQPPDTMISYQRLPIRDVSVPRSKEETVRILDAIDTHLESG